MSYEDRERLKLEVLAEDLIEVLGRLRQLHEELLDLLVEKEAAMTEVRLEDMESFRTREERLLRRVIEEEKQRLIITEELGDLLGHEEPTAMRGGEVLPHLPSELAGRLGAQLEGLRALALRLARQNAVNRALIEHSVGHIQVFLSKLAQEEICGQYGSGGVSSVGPSGPTLMDRRV